MTSTRCRTTQTISPQHCKHWLVRPLVQMAVRSLSMDSRVAACRLVLRFAKSESTQIRSPLNTIDLVLVVLKFSLAQAPTVSRAGLV